MFEILSICKGGGYKYCRTNPPHPKRNSKNLYPLHRVLVENKIGRLLTKDEEIHHIDGNKDNNEINNLEILTKREHARIHYQTKIPSKIILICPFCKIEFSLKPHAFRLRSKRTKSRIFCSKLCWYNRSKIKNDMTSFQLDSLGYKNLGWQNGWTKEKTKEVMLMAKDWKEGYSNGNSRNLQYSESAKIYFEYDCSD